MSVSRREFVSQVTGAGAGALWLAAAAACARDLPPDVATHGPPSDAAAPPRVLNVLTADEARVVEAIAARIIPTDDTPGAREAGVVWFIDWALGDPVAAEQLPVVRRGLADLARDVAAAHSGASSFAALTDAQQDSLLRAREDSEFFGTIRFATIAGMFALPKYGGNADYVGWSLVGQDHVYEHAPPFGWYDHPDNQRALLGRVL
jgi:gluconate 2-dehydrogenase gamma chain